MTRIKAIAQELGITQAALGSILPVLGIEKDEVADGDLPALRAVISIKRVQGVPYKKAAAIWRDTASVDPEAEEQQVIDGQGVQDEHLTSVLTHTRQSLQEVDEDDLLVAHRMAQSRAIRVMTTAEDLFPLYLGRVASASELGDRRAIVQGELEEVFCRPLLPQGSLISEIKLMPLLPPIPMRLLITTQSTAKDSVGSTPLSDTFSAA